MRRPGSPLNALGVLRRMQGQGLRRPSGARRPARTTRVARCGPLLAVALAGCADPGRPALPARHERYGVFRDLVLVVRSEARGGPFFLDRFETSRRDVLQWLAATQREPPAGWQDEWTDQQDGPALQRPAVRIDLATARAFAHWRWCRLPTLGEWEYAATAGGAYRFPWGDHSRAEWANTPALGLGQPAVIGTFESGRSPGGPYDLIGNVAEWTETLGPDFLRDAASAIDLPSMCLWSGGGRPVPALALLAGAPRPVPRLVVGGAYVGVSDVGPPFRGRSARVPVLTCCPEEWSDVIGVRLATDPRTLLAALLREHEAPPEPAAHLLREFLALPSHRAVLAPELAGVLAHTGAAGPLLPLLREALRP